MAEDLVHNRRRSRFEVYLDVSAGGADPSRRELAGYARYRLSNGVAEFDSTQIDPVYGGRGLGSKVVHFALEQAVAEGWRIHAVCPFVVAFLKRNHDFDDHLV